MIDGSDPATRAAWVKAQAREVGFELAGIARAEPSVHGAQVRAWLAAGFHGAMEFMAREVDERIDLRKKFPWAKSVLCVALAYYQPTPETGGVDEPRGKVARYAWGRDYHRVITQRLRQLEKRLREGIDEPFEARAYTDTGPLLERDLAARAGLGWVGKHTLLIHPGKGSYFLLGELVLSLDLAPDDAMPDHCGTCTRCIDACPTDAITPYVVDARACISYQTLENRGAVPEELQPAIAQAGFVVGCDICQEVCPHNRAPLETSEPDFAVQAPAPSVPLSVIDAWSEQEWDMATRGKAHRRAKFAMWKRNAQILAQAAGAEQSAVDEGIKDTP